MGFTIILYNSINVRMVRHLKLYLVINFLLVHGLLIFGTVLPDSVVDVNVINTFETRLDKH